VAVITVSKFSGVSPMTPPRYLGNDAAQTALNCSVWLGSLQPIRGAAEITTDPLTKTGTIKSIYRFGQDQTDETNYWFHWTTDVDVVQGFIAGDTSEKTYFTGDGAPKVTYAAAAIDTNDTNYPVVSYDLGVPKPSGTWPLITKGGTITPNTLPETRVYTCTYVNEWGEESAPYSASDMGPNTIDVYPGETVTVSFPDQPAVTEVALAKIRIYRSAAGTSESSFFFVGEALDTAVSYTDTVAGDALNEALPSLTWEKPKADMEGLVGLPNGVMAGFKGNDLYFSEPYRPFAWPIQYMQTAGYPIVGLAVVDTTLVVMTKGRPYFIQGSHPENMTMVEADVNQSCVSKKSIVVINKNVLYASPDGLVALSAGGSSTVTEGMFDKQAWQAMGPVGLIGQRYEDQYVGFLAPTGSPAKGFVYNMREKSWNFHSVSAAGGYNDLRHDSLYLIKNDALWKWDEGAVLEYEWKSKKFTFPEPKGLTCYRVQAETYPVTLKIFRDSTEIVSTSVTDGYIKRLPSGMGTDWEFQLEGNTEVYNVQLAQSPMEFNQG